MTEQDKKKLESYAAAAEGISRIFGSCCETGIYSFENGTASLIYAGGRESPGVQDEFSLTGSELQLLEKSKYTAENCAGPYISGSASEKQFRSVLVLIRNDSKELIGCICIRLVISTPLNQFMKVLFSPDQSSGERTISESYPDRVENLVQTAFLNIQKEMSEATGIAPIEKNKIIIQKLQGQGIFGIKGAVEIVAGALGVSKFTIYNYIRDVKDRSEDKGTESK
jgi:predicted transcriptional regulator YheO